MLKSFVKTVKYNASTNLYKILGVKEDSNFEEIKRKYIEKIKTTHPDTQDGCHNQFISLQKAFQTLKNPQKRLMYDRSIGIMEPVWQISTDDVTPSFQNGEIQRILRQKFVGKIKLKTSYENINMKYMEQMHLNQRKKYFYASLMLPTTAFAVFWLFWESSEVFLLNYKGKAKYIDKISKQGKDLSVAVTQIR